MPDKKKSDSDADVDTKTPLTSFETSFDAVDDIVKEARRGFSFVPFIGSGFSARSGILMGQDFSAYLLTVVWKVLGEKGLNETSKTGKADKANGPGYHDLRSRGWPPFPQEHEIQTARAWAFKEFRRICEEYGWEANEDNAAPGFILSVTPKEHSSSSTGSLGLELAVPIIPSVLHSPNCTVDSSDTIALLQRLGKDSLLTDIVRRVDYSPTSEEQITERAIRALHSWRLTIEFLARTAISIHNRPELGEIDTATIDAFNRFITNGKKPNMGHTMLAHLVRPLHIRCLMTTNFDDLTEQAFAELGYPLQTVSVSTGGGLPSKEAVFSQLTLIKLHGSRIETRADSSLDQPATPTDRVRFIEAVLGPQHQIPREAHLLVMGYSGADARCVQMLKYALDMTKELTLYWICYNSADIKNINNIFCEPSYQNRVKIHSTTRPDLFLYQLYQSLCYSLPSGGFAYEYADRVPPFPTPGTGTSTPFPQNTARSENTSGTFADLITLSAQTNADALHHAIQPIPLEVESFSLCPPLPKLSKKTAPSVIDRSFHDALEASRMIAQKIFAKQLALYLHDCIVGSSVRIDATSMDKFADIRRPTETRPYFIVDAGASVVSAIHTLLTKLTDNHGKTCFWFELNDYSNIIELSDDLMRCLSLNRGLYQKEHVQLSLFDSSQNTLQITEERLAERLAYLDLDPRRYVLAFYGRMYPGSGAGAFDQKWNYTEDYQLLAQFLRVLAQAPEGSPEKPRFHVLYLPLTKRRYNADEAKERDLAAFIQEHNLNGILSATPPALFPQPFFHDTHAIDKGCDPSSSLLIDAHGQYPKILQRLFKDWLEYEHSIADGSLRRDLPDPELKTSDDDEVDSKMNFLYACTLMRKSRHSSILFSEATYSCPFRFNEAGIDNDAFRALKVRSVLPHLRRLQIFQEKPGGFAWMYRDIRVGVQKYLLYQPTTLLHDRSKRIPRAARTARTHYWIGDWYFGAFLATGHYTPLFESIYHRVQCIRYAPFAQSALKAQDDLAYRRHLVMSSLLDIDRALRLCGKWVKFWSAGLTSAFDSHVKAIFNKEDADTGGLLDATIADHGGHLKFNKKDRESARDVLEQIRLYIIWLEQQIDRSKSSGEASVMPAITSATTTIGVNREFDVTEETLYDEVLDRNKIFIAKESDSPSPLLGELRKCIVEIGEKYSVQKNPSDYRPELERTVLDLVRDYSKYETDFTDADRSNSVDVISSLAYQVIKRAKWLYHSTTTPWWSDIKEVVMKKCAEKVQVRRLYTEATVYCYIAQELCRGFSGDWIGVNIQQKIKVLSLYSVALAYLGRTFDAHRRLNEATAWLSKWSSRSIDHEFGIIELRRAEVHLMEAHFAWRCSVDGILKDSQDLNDVSSKGLKSVFEDVRQPTIVSLLVCDPKLFDPDSRWKGSGSPAIPIADAAIQDAWGALDRAESHLSGKSHSTIWWGRLYSLRLRCLSVWNRAFTSDRSRLYSRGLMDNRRFWTQRIGNDAVQYAVSMVDRGLLVCDHDSLRQLRIGDYFLGAVLGIIPRENWKLPNKGDVDTLRHAIQRALGAKPKHYLGKKYKTLLEKSYRRIAPPSTSS